MTRRHAGVSVAAAGLAVCLTLAAPVRAAETPNQAEPPAAEVAELVDARRPAAVFAAPAALTRDHGLAEHFDVFPGHHLEAAAAEYSFDLFGVHDVSRS